MTHTVYFTDKAVIFTDERPSYMTSDSLLVEVDAEFEALDSAKLLKNLETYNSIYYLSASVATAFEHFKSHYAFVEAAGGVVVNPKGEWLMMERNGRWDFPKGHLEKGETLEECAVREIEEETGVQGRVVAHLTDTWHAYYFPKTERWELKCTYWYLLDFVATQGLKPQQEEGIHHVVWCDEAEREAHLEHTFPTIRCVAKALKDR